MYLYFSTDVVGMKVKQVVAVATVLVLVLIFSELVQSARVQYQYKKYTYRKKRDVGLHKKL